MDTNNKNIWIALSAQFALKNINSTNNSNVIDSTHKLSYIIKKAFQKLNTIVASHKGQVYNFLDNGQIIEVPASAFNQLFNIIDKINKFIEPVTRPIVVGIGSNIKEAVQEMVRSVISNKIEISESIYEITPKPNTLYENTDNNQFNDANSSKDSNKLYSELPPNLYDPTIPSYESDKIQFKRSPRDGSRAAVRPSVNEELESEKEFIGNMLGTLSSVITPSSSLNEQNAEFNEETPNPKTTSQEPQQGENPFKELLQLMNERGKKLQQNNQEGLESQSELQSNNVKSDLRQEAINNNNSQQLSYDQTDNEENQWEPDAEDKEVDPFDEYQDYGKEFNELMRLLAEHERQSNEQTTQDNFKENQSELEEDEEESKQENNSEENEEEDTNKEPQEENEEEEEEIDPFDELHTHHEAFNDLMRLIEESQNQTDNQATENVTEEQPQKEDEEEEKEEEEKEEEEDEEEEKEEEENKKDEKDEEEVDPFDEYQEDQKIAERLAQKLEEGNPQTKPLNTNTDNKDNVDNQDNIDNYDNKETDNSPPKPQLRYLQEMLRLIHTFRPTLNKLRADNPQAYEKAINMFNKLLALIKQHYGIVSKNNPSDNVQDINSEDFLQLKKVFYDTLRRWHYRYKGRHRHPLKLLLGSRLGRRIKVWARNRNMWRQAAAGMVQDTSGQPISVRSSNLAAMGLPSSQ